MLRRLLEMVLVATLTVSCQLDRAPTIECADNDECFLEHAPACPAEGGYVLLVEGVFAGDDVDIEQRADEASGLVVTLGPGGTFRALDERGVLRSLTWAAALAPNVVAPITSGNLEFAGDEGSNSPFCVERGRMVMPASPVLGEIRFALASLRSGTNCEGKAVETSLFGCWTPGP